jgi:hypothetical protein
MGPRQVFFRHLNSRRLAHALPDCARYKGLHWRLSSSHSAPRQREEIRRATSPHGPWGAAPTFPSPNNPVEVGARGTNYCGVCSVNGLWRRRVASQEPSFAMLTCLLRSGCSRHPAGQLDATEYPTLDLSLTADICTTLSDIRRRTMSCAEGMPREASDRCGL